ncbi:MAG: uroporphyrinogen-III C-methyltransferase [Gammaproteobacteria bacterium]|nr:uroporphyrinogen-III C-methyltransferase [Gammaproteobacteria bacterium]
MTDQPTSVQQPTKKPCSILPFFTLILVLIASAAALYALFIAKENTQAIMRLSSFTKKKVIPYSELTTTLATISEAHASLQTQLSVLSQRVNTQQPASKNHIWVGEQAKYYLELAVVESTVGNNIPGCITLLQQAEKLLESLSDESLRPVFVAIQQTTQALQALPQSSTASTLLQIHQLHSLLSNAFPAPTPTMTTLPSDGSIPSLKQIQSLISIKHHQPNKQAAITFQQTLLSGRIDLNLQIAQAALLQHNTQLYQLSIQEAIKETQALPTTAASVKQPILDALHALETTQAFIQSPSLEAPLKAINDWIAQQQSALPKP